MGFKAWRNTVGSAAAIALLTALTLGSAEPQPQTKNKGSPPQKSGTRMLKRTVVPLQRDIKLALASNNEFHDPQEQAEVNVHELRVTQGTFTSPAAGLQGAPQTFQLLCYNGHRIGPTIRVRRGSTFRIHVKNELKGDPDPGPGDNPPTSEKPHGLCTTNLHTHGLHVSPAGNADNIFKAIEPGKDCFFEYTLGADHPAGTFWYHPHHHGSVAYQVSNALAGALIVEGAPGDRHHDLDRIPEIARMKDRVLILQLYNYNVDQTAKIDARTIYNIQPDQPSCPAISITAPIPPNAPQATAINGVIVPTIRMAPGEAQRWRLVHASWDELRPLVFVDDQDAPTTDLQFREVALDGLATGAMVVKPILELAPGQRSDVLIQAPLLKGKQQAVYFLKQQAVSAARSLHATPTDPAYLAKIVVTGTPKPMALPPPAALRPCRPFDSIRDEELTWPPSVGSGLTFAADDNPKDGSPPYYTINGKTFHNQPPLRVKLGTAEQWTITAGKSNHPFHIHVNPFQVVMHTDANGKSTPLNMWRDTLLIPEHESFTIRMRFADYPGATVLHCHILDHEDQGMMMRFEIVDPAAKPGAAQPALKPCAIAAPRLQWSRANCTDATDLAAFRGRNVILVFFQGAECQHCTTQLRDLVHAARKSLAPDTEIVAVSSRAVPSLAKALAVLGLAGPDCRFHLVADPTHRSFRDFGCYDAGPMHGLYLIDHAGIIRAQYAGEMPFDNIPEVLRRLQRLNATQALLPLP